MLRATARGVTEYAIVVEGQVRVGDPDSGVVLNVLAEVTGSRLFREGLAVPVSEQERRIARLRW